jgi:ribosomal-protein-alanine N-acetyltransferase
LPVPRSVRVLSDRLILRELVVTDEAAVHAYAADPVVTRFMVWGPNSTDETHRFITEAIADSQSPDRKLFDLAIVHRESQTLIGGAALRILDPEQGHGEIGYVLNRDYWSRGYATETAHALLRFGIDGLGLRRISATCDPENHASARVLQKAGLQFERRIPHHLCVRGEWRDSLLFACASGDG